MKSLKKKEVAISIIYAIIALAVAVLLFVLFSISVSIIALSLIYLPYFIFLSVSEKTYFSLPGEIKKYVKENNLGDIVEIKDVEKRKESIGVCEYDYDENVYVKRTIVTSKNKEINISESYVGTTYTCDYNLA